MDVKDAIALKARLDAEIEALIDGFQTKTGLRVSGIEVLGTESISGSRPRPIVVSHVEV